MFLRYRIRATNGSANKSRSLTQNELGGGHVATSLGATTLGLLTSKWLESKILSKEFTVSGLPESILVASFIAFMFMFYFAHKQSAKENLSLKAANAESELHVLKNQLQPHFLFNSLNSLAELIESNSDSAADMAMKLSDLYREILENSKKSMTTLDSEISIVTKYLDLEKIRFGDRLNYSIEVPNNSSAIEIPPLLTQTLVENAVKHGIAPAKEGGMIKVSVYSHAISGYYMSVVNTHASSHKTSGTATGLANTKARLDLYYGARHGFSLKNLKQTIEASFWFSGDSARV